MQTFVCGNEVELKSDDKISRFQAESLEGRAQRGAREVEVRVIEASGRRRWVPGRLVGFEVERRSGNTVIVEQEDIR